MKRVLFIEKKHQYLCEKKIYTSVTTLLKKYQKPMDTKFWSAYKACEEVLGAIRMRTIRSKFPYRKGKGMDDRLKEMGRIACDLVGRKNVSDIQQRILRNWKEETDKACLKGTIYHTTKEDQSLFDGYKINSYDANKYQTFKKERIAGCDNYSITENLYDLKQGFYPELLVFNHELEIAGQADLVFIEELGNKKYIDIDDFKTNKKIKTDNPFQKLLGPLSHLDDCEFSKYAAQLNLYGWLLSQFGFIIRSMCFHHYKEKYTVPNLQTEITQIMQERKKELIKDVQLELF